MPTFRPSPFGAGAAARRARRDSDAKKSVRRDSRGRTRRATFYDRPVGGRGEEAANSLVTSAAESIDSPREKFGFNTHTHAHVRLPKHGIDNTAAFPRQPARISYRRRRCCCVIDIILLRRRRRRS